MQYPTLETCRDWIFPLIRQRMGEAEPVPRYENERRGLERLGSILSLMQREDYPDPLSKASYLFCSVIDGHPFSNGNKRLAVALLCGFLILNDFSISGPSMEAVRDELKWLFPKLKWEDVESFTLPHEFFFYHLALIIADRTQKGALSFQQEQAAVHHLLQFITQTRSE